jgi:hypothetical protein
LPFSIKKQGSVWTYKPYLGRSNRVTVTIIQIDTYTVTVTTIQMANGIYPDSSTRNLAIGNFKLQTLNIKADTDPSPKLGTGNGELETLN